MQHIRSLEAADLSRPSLVTIGVFDGVHRGHQHLIRQMVAYARSNDLLAVALTFYPYPAMVIGGFRLGYYLTLPDAKAKYLGELDIDLVVTHPFDDRVRHIRAADFVDSLISHLHMQALWVGADFAMGYQREGDVAFLQEQAKQRGFEVRVVDLMDAGGERISSSRIRAELQRGDMKEVTRLLGRPYRLSGTVVEGAKRGRTIGIPTANLAISEEQAVPPRGVYAALAYVDNRPWQAVVNIGLRPTFDGQQSNTVVEAHLLDDFAADIYGQEVELAFIARLRDERTFDGVAELLAQIQRDIAAARKLLSEHVHGQ